MENGALLKRLISEFAKTIDDSLLPETTTSSIGLKIAAQMQWRVKKVLDLQEGQPRQALFINAISKLLYSEFDYQLIPESIEKDRMRFRVKRCPFQEGNSPSLCSFMRGVIGGLGFLSFGYSKVVAINVNPETGPCSFDLYTAPAPEAEKRIGLEYSRSAMNILKGEDEKYIDSQRQARRKLILGLFSSLAFSLHDDPSVKQLTQKFIESLSCIPEIRIAALYLQDKESGNFVLKDNYGIPEKFEHMIRTINPEEYALTHRVKAKLEAIEDFNGQRLEIAKASAVRTFISMKVETKQRVLGALNIGWRATFPVSPETVESIKACCALLGTAIDNSQLYFELEKTYVENVSVLNSLVNAVDQFSNDHSMRVAELAKDIAKEMGLPEDDLVLIYEAGRIHDIGKVTIPIHILNKPGRLTDEEFEIIKEHPLIAEKLLSPIKGLQKLVPAIKYHHEKLDGSGYPEGLVGEDIPIHARVIAVADVYDAMTNARSYHKAKNELEALQEIINGSGTKFDTAAVGALVAILNSRDLSVLEDDQEREGVYAE
ncbi:MAG: HD domain-containing phosphohydrolase [Candidatus Aquicultor sp.]